MSLTPSRARQPSVCDCCRSLYALALGGAVGVLAVDVAIKRPENFICLGGLALLIIISFFISSEPEKVGWF